MGIGLVDNTMNVVADIQEESVDVAEDDTEGNQLEVEKFVDMVWLVLDNVVVVGVPVEDATLCIVEFVDIADLAVDECRNFYLDKELWS
ncbi:hypothetical protein WICPIJ_000896 [Wickerhamomyces pijperi]|uniref:Uncharacterized protein n=1 Tax=Wickerhamomyces pijperi TaxID=599730 RepID=A0A9P8QER8_WICPI|nr:hypothetical protein WICPIJ_000896 [Wickerhamomyces pijperi]